MAGRDRVRYVLCEASSSQSFGKGITSEHFLLSFRDRVRSLWGELGLATFGCSASVVYNFSNFCGVFVVKIPALSTDKCLAAISSMIELSNRSVTVRAIHVSGRLTNTVREVQERLLLWRSSVPSQYEVSRRAQLDEMLKAGLASLEKDSGNL